MANISCGRAANGQAGVGSGYDCSIRRESVTSVIVNVTQVGGQGDYLERIEVPISADLDALARRIAASPFEYVEADVPDEKWNALAERWNQLGDEPWTPSSLQLTPQAAVRLEAWIAEVANSTVRRGAFEGELLDVARERLVAGESLSYELGSQYTVSGRPELFVVDAADLEVVG